MNDDVIFSKRLKERFGARNEFSQYRTGNIARIAINGAGDKDTIGYADADKIVNIHDHAILSGFSESSGVAGLFVV